jgi:N6-adenosine-specific RNA methylase IME4
MMSKTPILLFPVSVLFEFSLVSYSSATGRIFSWLVKVLNRNAQKIKMTLVWMSATVDAKDTNILSKE